MKTQIKAAFAAAVVATSISIAPQAHAGGWIADTFIRPFSPQAAKAADDWNRRNGHVVEHTIAGLATSVSPVAGAVLQGGWALQRSGALNGGFVQPMPQQAPLGNFCNTPVGRFGPGQPLPLGSACHGFVNGQPVNGQIGL